MELYKIQRRVQQIDNNRRKRIQGYINCKLRIIPNKIIYKAQSRQISIRLSRRLEPVFQFNPAANQ
jgi:hypothetical protein